MAPDGLSIRAISKHVYNRHNTFFEQADMDDIKVRVTRFLSTRSRTRHPIIVNTGRRGVYKLNPKLNLPAEMRLEFDDDYTPSTASDTPQRDTSPVELMLDL